MSFCEADVRGLPHDHDGTDVPHDVANCSALRMANIMKCRHVSSKCRYGGASLAFKFRRLRSATAQTVQNAGHEGERIMQGVHTTSSTAPSRRYLLKFGQRQLIPRRVDWMTIRTSHIEGCWYTLRLFIRIATIVFGNSVTFFEDEHKDWAFSTEKWGIKTITATPQMLMYRKGYAWVLL